MLNKQELLIRLSSALVILVIFLAAIFLFRALFYIIIFLITIIMLYEWYNMTKFNKLYLISGCIIIPISMSCLMLISRIDNSGWILFSNFAAIWSVDTMAMIGGKTIGGPKLAPKLSPNKTISGLIIGVCSAVIVTNLIYYLSGYSVTNVAHSYFDLSIKCLILGVIAQISDLFISFFKRKFNIKDTGAIIPGHGGMLDRFDSFILTAPLVYIYLINII